MAVGVGRRQQELINMTSDPQKGRVQALRLPEYVPANQQNNFF